MDQRESRSEPGVEEILAEVERRRTGRRRPGGRARSIIVLVDRFVFWLTKHWLAVLNTLAFLYVGLAFVAPVLMALSLNGPARLIYALYGLECHQLPQRSWFLFGPRLAYGLEELRGLVGSSSVPGPFSSAFVGNEVVGYKVALCQRCVALYGALFLSGALYALLRHRWNVRPLRIWLYVLVGVLPMAVDGGYQWISYLLSVFFPGLHVVPHETTPLMRTVTGVLFGWATVWLAYPYVQETMAEFRGTLQRRFGWE